MCNKETISKIQFLQNLSKPFQVKSNLRHGDAFYPKSFNLDLVKNSKRKKRVTKNGYKWRIGDVGIGR